MNDREVHEAANTWLRDASDDDLSPRLTVDEIEQIQQKAALSLQLDPLPPGGNDGRVYYRGKPWLLAFDSNGHEAFAEFISNAQPWVLALAREALYLRDALQTIADDSHAPDCHRVSPYIDFKNDLACGCHATYAAEVLAT